MDSISEPNEVIQQNTLSPSQIPKLVDIKKEVCEEDLNSKSDQYDDYDFEPFHENIFRTLSANFDNSTNIDQVNQAYAKLENCFIQNHILTKNSVSKINLKGPASDTVFLKYRDIDDAFTDMVISESTTVSHEISNLAPKKIDLKPFNDSFFSINLNDSSLSDNEEFQSKNGESDSDGIEEFESQVEGSFSENDVSDFEASVNDEFDDSLDENDVSVDVDIDINATPICDVKSEKLMYPLSCTKKVKSDTDLVPEVENSCDSLGKENVRDVRIVVEKLHDALLIQGSNTENSLEDQLVSKKEEYLSKFPSKSPRQVARKKTGGMIINNVPTQDSCSSKEQKIIHQLSSKDGDFVPNVFDKMTRAGKRDLERVLKESTVNRAKQEKNQDLEKNKESVSDGKDSGNSSLVEEESKHIEIQKTAEMFTETILQFLTKNKSKNLEKLKKDITEEIANKINNFKFSIEASNDAEEPSSTQPPVSPKKLSTPLPLDNTEKYVDNKVEKLCDNTEENIPRRVTRESSRLSALRNKNTKKINTNSVNTRKTLAEQFEEIERDIVNCGLADEEADEPRRPETRRSKQKYENLKGTSENIVPNLETKRSTPPKRKSISKSKKKMTGKNVTKQIKNTSISGDVESITDGELIDGQFLIDSALNEDSLLSISDLGFNNVSKSSNSSPLADRIILKASADSTTSEIGFINNEISANDVTSSDVISTVSCDENNADKEFVSSDVRNVSKSISEEESCPAKDNRKDEECQNKCLKEANLMQSSKDINLMNDTITSGLIATKDCKDIVHSVENKENLQAEDVSNTIRDKNECESGRVMLKTEPISGKSPQNELPECGSLQPSVTQNITNDSSYSYVKSNNYLENKETAKSAHVSVSVNESFEQVNEPFKVLNDMITEIEKKVLQEEIETREMNVKELSFKIRSDANDCKTSKPDDVKDSSNQSLEVSADSTSFLSYTMDDSFRLMIDEGQPEDDLSEKDMELDTSLESNENNDLRINENSETFTYKTTCEPGETVCNMTEKKTSHQDASKVGNDNKFSVSKPLTNEQKIAQLTKRDPRLFNDKKIVNVLRRDPRIRNKLPKVEEGREKPETANSESPLSPDQEPVVPSFKPLAPPVPVIAPPPVPPPPPPPPPPPVVIPEVKDEKNTALKETQETTSSELSESNADLNRKKKLKKKVDEELIYKTPLSDLHETHSDRPSYERSTKKKKVPPAAKKGREIEEDNRPNLQRLSRPPELNEVGRGYNYPPEERNTERYYNRDSFDERKLIPNPEEGYRKPDGQYYGGKFEGRNFYQEKRVDFRHGSRDNFEQEEFVRRTHIGENFGGARDRNELSDSHIYTRREFFRRNKYAHDHDHFGNSSRMMDPRQNNQYFSQQNTFCVPDDTAFRISAYPPVSLLPDPNYSQEEEFDQTYGNMETDSFSPPSSDLCPPPPLLRSPSPELLRRDNYCPSPARIGKGNSPNERDFDDYNRNFHRNYEREDRSFRGRNNFNRELGSNRGYRTGNNRRGKGRDFHWKEESPPRKRFAPDFQCGSGREERGRWRRSPSWSPERSREWSRERSISPHMQHDPHPWDSPRTPSPPRWHDNYRERMPPYKNYQRFN